jgi:hypothetical protein
MNFTNGFDSEINIVEFDNSRRINRGLLSSNKNKYRQKYFLFFYFLIESKLIYSLDMLYFHSGY